MDLVIQDRGDLVRMLLGMSLSAIHLPVVQEYLLAQRPDQLLPYIADPTAKYASELLAS